MCDTTTYVRARAGETFYPGRAFAPLKADHPLIGDECPACRRRFVEGDQTMLIALGPGDDPEEWEKCQKGRWFTSAAVAVHAQCGGA